MTKESEKSPDCIVIGAGLIGMLTARELVQAGQTVMLIERGEAGQESSWAGGGILSPLYSWRYPEPVNTLAAWGQRQYPALAQALLDESGIDPEWTNSGLLILDADVMEPAYAWAQRHDARISVLNHQAIIDTEPRLHIDSDTAMLMPDIAQIRNPRLVRALRRSLERAGVEIREHTEVRRLLQHDGRIGGIETTDGQLDCGQVVIAGGAWSGGLLASFALNIEIEPVRGQMLLFKTSPGEISHIMLYRGHYLIPRRDGHVLVGSTVEYVGFDKSTTIEAREELRQLAVELVPSLARGEIVRHWSGLRPGSPQSIPYIGGVPAIEGLYLNTGHFRNGVVLGPASARLLVDQMLQRPPIIDPSPFAITRQG